MLGAFQRKVIFGEYATCDRREVGVVRALRMSSRGQEGAPRRGVSVPRAGQTRVGATIPPPAPALQPGWPVLWHSHLPAHLELSVIPEAFPDPRLWQTPRPGRPLLPGAWPHWELPARKLPADVLLRVSASLEGQLWTPALASPWTRGQPWRRLCRPVGLTEQTFRDWVVQSPVWI